MVTKFPLHQGHKYARKKNWSVTYSRDLDLELGYLEVRNNSRLQNNN